MSCQVIFPIQDIVLLLRDQINPEIIGAVPEDKLEEGVLLFLQPKLDLLQQQLDQIPDEVHVVSQNLDGNVLETTLSNGQVFMTDFTNVITGIAGTIAAQAFTDGVTAGIPDANVLVQPPFTGTIERTQRDKNSDFVSIHDYCKCDGVTDDTAGFINAINAAKNNNKKLISYNGTIKITSDVNLRNLTFDLSGSTIKTFNNAMVIVGTVSSNGFSKQQILGQVFKDGAYSIDPDFYTSPSVRLMGSKSLYFKFDQIDYLQLYASTDPVNYKTDSSIAYCFIVGGMTTRLELTTDPRYANGANTDGPASANQWINSNVFFIQRIFALDVKGSYHHNQNTFYGGTFERIAQDVRINFEVGWKNCVLNFRGEGYPRINFGVGTKGNIVQRSWFGSENTYLTYDNNEVGRVTDLGTNNKVTSIFEEVSHVIPVFNIDVMRDSAYNGQHSNYGKIVPTRRKIYTAESYMTIAETKPFEFGRSDVLSFYCNTINAVTSRYIVRISMYDSQANKITIIDSSWFTTNKSFTVNAAGYIEGSFYSTSDTFFSLTSDGASNVSYISVALIASSSAASMNASKITVNLVTMRDAKKIHKNMINKADLSVIAVTKPTKYVGKLGDTINALPANYKVSFYKEDKVVSTSDTSVTISSGVVGGIGVWQADDLIGIDLDDGTTHWTTIVSVTTNSAVLTTAIPSAASAGNGVYIARIV